MFIPVPFKTETASGLTSVNGVAKFSGAGIVMEFESKVLGLFGSGIKEVRLPIDEILDIKFKKGIFRRSAKIVIRTKSFARFAELPVSDGKLTLCLVREDLERGSDAVDTLQRHLTGRGETLGPPRTPVDELFEDETAEFNRRN